ncbi:MAG: riboflavin synthase, partial [Chlorobiota bacterium]
MFTGLVEEVGVLRSVRYTDGGRELTIGASRVVDDLAVGDSIAVQGVCLTVTERGEDWFRVRAIEETLRKTTLGSFEEKAHVNLERALLPTRRLGGHIVHGHIETVGRIAALEPLQSSWELWVECPKEYMRYVVPLGSIALDGISLTVARIQAEQFMVAIIPHTWEQTTLRFRRVGDGVNLEF